MSYHAGFSAVGSRSEAQDSGLVTIIDSPENPVQIGYATPVGNVSDNGQQPYTLCLFGDRRPVLGDWFLEDGQFWPADEALDPLSGVLGMNEDGLGPGQRALSHATESTGRQRGHR